MGCRPKSSHRSWCGRSSTTWRCRSQRNTSRRPRCDGRQRRTHCADVPRGGVVRWCPSLVIAYSPCIAHGYDLRYGLEQQKKAVLSGHWPLFHYDPRLAIGGGQAFHLDSKPPSIPLEDYIYSETRYRMLTQSDPVEARRLLVLAQQDVNDRWLRYEQLARKDGSNGA